MVTHIPKAELTIRMAAFKLNLMTWIHLIQEYQNPT